MDHFRFECVLEQSKEFCGSRLIKENDMLTVEREYDKLKVFHNKQPVGYLTEKVTSEILKKRPVFVQLRCSKIDDNINLYISGHPVRADIEYEPVGE